MTQNWIHVQKKKKKLQGNIFIIVLQYSRNNQFKAVLMWEFCDFFFFFFKFQGATIPTRHSYFQVFSRSLLLLWRFLLGFDWDRVSFIVACVVIFFWLLIKRVLITHQRFSCSWALIVQSFCVIFSVSQTFLLASRLKDA